MPSVVPTPTPSAISTTISTTISTAISTRISAEIVSDLPTTQPQFISLFPFLQNACDFWTDIMFALALVLCVEERWDLFWPCVFTIGVPYILSCIVGIYCIHRWRLWSDAKVSRLSNYVEKHDWLLYVGMVFVGFFSVIDLTKQTILFTLFLFTIKTI